MTKLGITWGCKCVPTHTFHRCHMQLMWLTIMSSSSKYSVLKNSNYSEEDNISGISYLPTLDHHDDVEIVGWATVLYFCVLFRMLVLNYYVDLLVVCSSSRHGGCGARSASTAPSTPSTSRKFATTDRRGVLLIVWVLTHPVCVLTYKWI